MRTQVLCIIAALLLAGCGNEKEIASLQTDMQRLKAQYKALNDEKAEKHPGWLEIRSEVIPLQRAFMAAKRSNDEAALAQAKEELEAAQAAATAVAEEERLLANQIRDVQVKMEKVEREIRKLGGKP
jgi:predicted  nucleic acid-binding Zn-ribbon protein